MARKARKIKDKWKEKKWVHVIAPDSFNNVTLGYVPITDDENAKGRVLEVTLWDIPVSYTHRRCRRRLRCRSRWSPYH